MSEALAGILQAKDNHGAFAVSGAAEVFAALAKAQAEFGDIVRSKTVSVRSDKGTYTFDYAPLESVLAATVPALNRHGLALLQPLCKEGQDWILRTIIAHSSGAFVQTMLVIPSPDRGGWQALGGAITYARRYMVGALLGVAPEEDDDGTSAEGMHRDVAPKGPRSNSQPTPPKPPPQKEPAKVTTKGDVHAPPSEGLPIIATAAADKPQAAFVVPIVTREPEPPESIAATPVTPEQKEKCRGLMRLLGITTKAQADQLAGELANVPSLGDVNTSDLANLLIEKLEARMQDGGNP